MQAVKLSIQAYSAVDHDPHGLRGFVKLDRTNIWEAIYESENPEASRRGVNVMAIDPVTLEFYENSDRTFDTHGKREAAGALGKYLEQMADGVIIVGVTADEPMAELRKATGTLELLEAYGIDVSDVQRRGSFVFVLQKGYLYKTQFDKSEDNTVYPSALDVELCSDPSGPAGLDIRRVWNPRARELAEEDDDERD